MAKAERAQHTGHMTTTGHMSGRTMTAREIATWAARLRTAGVHQGALELIAHALPLTGVRALAQLGVDVAEGSDDARAAVAALMQQLVFDAEPFAALRSITTTHTTLGICEAAIENARVARPDALKETV